MTGGNSRAVSLYGLFFGNSCGTFRTAPPQSLSLSPPLALSRGNLSLYSRPRRLIIANSSNGSNKIVADSGDGAGNNGGKSGGGGGGKGRSGGGGRRRNYNYAPTFSQPDQFSMDPSLIEYFDKNQVEITKAAIIALASLLGFVGMFEFFLHMIGYYDWREMKLREEANLKGNGSYGKAV